MEKKKIIQVSEQTHRQITAYKAMYGLKTIDGAILDLINKNGLANHIVKAQKEANNG